MYNIGEGKCVYVSKNENQLSQKELEIAADALKEYKNEILNELEGCRDDKIREKVNAYLHSLEMTLDRLQRRSTVVTANELRILHSAAEKYCVLLQKRYSDRRLSEAERESTVRALKYAASIEAKTKAILDSHRFINLRDLEQ